MEAAPAAAHRQPPTYRAAQERRVAARRGAQRAAVAVAHSLLVLIYPRLSRQAPYHELGGDDVEERDRHERARRLARQREAWGYTVVPPPASGACGQADTIFTPACAGTRVEAIPPAYTSQDCSGCGERMQLSLSMRTHVCTNCGLILDRDENAARNVLWRGQRLRGVAGMLRG